MHDPRILVGAETGDDAGVFALHDRLALVQTVDVITPVVDDEDSAALAAEVVAASKGS